MNKESKSVEFILRFALFSALAIIPIAVFFLWGNSYSISSPIDDGKFGTFGDFTGGVLGSVWSLCGVLLFYSALKEQREDFKNNREALSKQIEALEIQSREFRLQREELKESRKVFSEQSKTFRHQRFDSTYFSLLGLYKQTVENLDKKDASGDYFRFFRERLSSGALPISSYCKNHDELSSRYQKVFYSEMQGLGHYFKLIYRILKIIDEYDIAEGEKFRYAKILRSQMSENELLAIFYNSHSPYGKESYKLILKYNLLKHLPFTSRIECQFYLLDKLDKEALSLNQGVGDLGDISSRTVKLMAFNDEIEDYIRVFLENLNSSLKSDGFDELKVSKEFIQLDGMVVSLRSEDSNELRLDVLGISDDLVKDVFGFFVSDFISYFEAYLCELFLYSNYMDFKDIEIKCFEQGDGKFCFEIFSEKKLSINSDVE